MSEKKKILVCDDSILARKQLSDVIRNYMPAVEIIEAADGEQAVEKYKEHHPVLTFLDIVMPKEDGIHAVRDIIADDADADIVIVSSVGTQEKLKDAIEAGARDFIQKPFSEEQIQKLLKNHLGED